MTCGIYCLTNNVNGKSYVGQSRDIEKRWSSYRKLRCTEQPKIYRALRRYGVESFSFSVLITCPPECLDEYEATYIQQLKSSTREHGYNIAHAARGSGAVSDETRRKMSESLKGRSPSEAHRRKISESKTGKKNPCLSARQRVQEASNSPPVFEDMPDATWRRVPGFSRYWLSSSGHVAYVAPDGLYRIKSLPTTKSGHRLVCLADGDVKRSVNLIRLMAEVWLGQPPEAGRWVTPLDGEIGNVDPSNLAWSSVRPGLGKNKRSRKTEEEKTAIASDMPVCGLENTMS